MVNHKKLYGKTWACVGVLIFAACVMFGRTLGFSFVTWDDGSLVFGNRLINPPTVQGLLDTWKAPHEELYIPITYNLWWVLAWLGRLVGTTDMGPTQGLAAWPYHAANVLVHLLNTLLVFFVLRRFVRFSLFAATVGASVFLLHPLQAEAVCWVTGMKDLLSSVLAISGVVAYLVSSESFKEGQAARGRRFYLLAFIAFVLAGFAKPGVVAVPIVGAAIDIAFVGGWSRFGILRVVGLICAVLPSALMTSFVQQVHYDPGISVLFRPTIALHAIGFYISKIFAPTRLCVDYGLRPLIVLVEPGHLILTAIVPLYMLVMLLARGFRKQMTVMGVVFLAGVLPVLGLTPFGFQYYSTVADRYVYVSMIAAAMAAGYLCENTPRLSFRFLLVLAILGLCVQMWRQVGMWRDTISLMGQVLRINPRTSVGYNNLANSLLPSSHSYRAMKNLGPATQPERNTKVRRDELAAKAEELYQAQMAARVGTIGALQNFIWLEAHLGDYETAIGLAHVGYRMAPILGWNPEKYVVDHFGFATLYFGAGDLENAAKWICAGLARDPYNPKLVHGMIFLLQEQKKKSATSASASQLADVLTK